MRYLLIGLVLLVSPIKGSAQSHESILPPTTAEPATEAQQAAEGFQFGHFHERFIALTNFVQRDGTSSYRPVLAIYGDLDEIWSYSLTDPIGAFFNDQTLPGKYTELKRKYPGFADFIRDFEIRDSTGAVYVPSAETREFLASAARRELRKAAEAKSPSTSLATKTAPKRVAIPEAGQPRSPADAPSAGVPAVPPVSSRRGRAAYVPATETPALNHEWRRDAFLRGALMTLALILLAAALLQLTHRLFPQASPSGKLREFYRRRMARAVRAEPVAASAWAVVLGVAKPVYHRGVRSIAVDPVAVGIRLMFALIPDILLMLSAGAVLAFHADLAWSLLDWTGARPVMASAAIGGVAFTVPTVSTYAPGRDLYSASLAVFSILLASLLLLRPGRWTPARVLWIFVAFVNAVSASFFFFAGDRFPYTVEQFASMWVSFEFVLWLLIPWMFAFFVAPLTNALEALLITCATIGYAICFSAVRLAALLDLFYWGGSIWMASGYFVFGFLADFLYVTAFYSLAVSRASGFIAQRREAWTW